MATTKISNDGCLFWNYLIYSKSKRENINSIILQVSVNALGEIEELLKHETKAELIEPCIDHLFSTCAMQVRDSEFIY